MALPCLAARVTSPETSVISPGSPQQPLWDYLPWEVYATSPGLQEPSPSGHENHVLNPAATETIPSGRSVPPHWPTSVPSPGHQGRLTGVAGASPIWPDPSIAPPGESSAPGAASVACGARLRPGTRHQLSLADCRAERHRNFRSPSLWLLPLLPERPCRRSRRPCAVAPPAGRGRDGRSGIGRSPGWSRVKGGGPSQRL